MHKLTVPCNMDMTMTKVLDPILMRFLNQITTCNCDAEVRAVLNRGAPCLLLLQAGVRALLPHSAPALTLSRWSLRGATGNNLTPCNSAMPVQLLGTV